MNIVPDIILKPIGRKVKANFCVDKGIYYRFHGAPGLYLLCGM
jgi:hypothetical protein